MEEGINSTHRLGDALLMYFVQWTLPTFLLTYRIRLILYPASKLWSSAEELSYMVCQVRTFPSSLPLFDFPVPTTCTAISIQHHSSNDQLLFLTIFSCMSAAAFSFTGDVRNGGSSKNWIWWNFRRIWDCTFLSDPLYLLVTRCGRILVAPFSRCFVLCFDDLILSRILLLSINKL